MNEQGKDIVILLAEDDEDDRLITREAFQESRLFSTLSTLYCVENGEELMDYLYRRGKYSEPMKSPRPGIILLDLNMPCKDGREALKEIKSDPSLANIPVIVLTTSKAEEDILRSYNVGANSYITKPVSFDGLVEVLRIIGDYWFCTVELPLLA